MKLSNTVMIALLIVGGLNWGLVGLFDLDLVKTMFGQGIFARIVYTAVGIAAVGKLFLWNTEESAA